MSKEFRLSFGLEYRPGRHYFDIPEAVRASIDKHTRNAIKGVSHSSFSQEPDYIAAIAARLNGVAYHGTHGTVEFNSTIVESRGPNSAESLSGADWALTATIRFKDETIRKAILIQAKLGAVDDLAQKERDRLDTQIRDMRRLTKAPKVLEVPLIDGQRVPRVISGSGLISGHRIRRLPLETYLSSHVVTTLHGDTRYDFVEGVKDSKLTRLDIQARLR